MTKPKQEKETLQDPCGRTPPGTGTVSSFGKDAPMTARKKKPATANPVVESPGRSLKDEAKARLARPKSSPDPAGQTPEELIHELQVHQIELETQAEELRRAHLALEESRNKYLDLYEFAPVGYLTLTDKALIEEANLTGARLLGIVRSKLINTRFRRLIVPKDHEVWDRHFITLLKTSEKQIFEIELVHSEGAVFPARLDCTCTKVNNAPPVIRIAISDITLQKTAEATIRESEERFWRLFSEIPIPYQSLDGEGRLLEVSPEWLEVLGYTREEVIGREFWDFLLPENRGIARDVFKQFRDTGAVNHVELWLKKKDGSTLLALYTGRIGHNPDGSFRQTYGIFEDITGRKQAEEKLVASVQEKEVLLREIHHRVKNNLQLISGLLDMTRMRTTDEATTSVLTDIMLKIQTMAQIHNRLYESKQFGRIDITAQFRQQVMALSNIFSGKGHEIHCEITPEIINLPVDQALPCALVVNEILSNAYKHAFKGRKQGLIIISAVQKNGRVGITIRDNGIGLPANFDISSSSSLGLKLIKTLVQHQLKGEIMLKSQDGTEVSLEFPVISGD